VIKYEKRRGAGRVIFDNDEVKLKIKDFSFTWDDEKAELNLLKHKVSFKLGAEIFFDGNALESSDIRLGENRYRLLGMTFSSLLLVVIFVERITLDGEDVFRIISARRATKEERLDYEQNL
jgi:uncharacterized DUF497 family protein